MSLRKIIGIASVMALGATTVYGMGCSSSTNSGPGVTQDSGTKTDTGAAKDSSVTDTGGGDAGGDGAGGDGGMTCPDNTAFTAIIWAPPTPLHQGACTGTQIAAWNSSQSQTTGLGTSGNAACDACIVTPETAAAHGPVITQKDSMGNAFLAEFNSGGCIADEDGAKAAGSCGNQLNNEDDCLVQQCFSCSDFNSPTKGGPTGMCEQAIFGMGGLCAKYLIAQGSACDSELNADGGVQACFAATTNIEFFQLWCGSGTTPPPDAGTDTGTPSDSGGGG
jgi:hypothetical protein